MCGAPEVRAHSKCYNNNNGSETTVIETVEQTWVVYHVAEPQILYTHFFQAAFFEFFFWGGGQNFRPRGNTDIVYTANVLAKMG
jgi:hypothetical protein